MRGVEQIPWLYDLGLAMLERSGLARWRRWVVGGAAGRTLDLGSGTGRNLPLFAADARVVALDPHRRNVARARRRAGDIALVVGRAEALPFKAGVFATVVSSLAFCSVDDPEAALAEVRRVLAPGGTLRMMEHVRRSGLRGRIQDLVQPAWTWATGGCRPNRDTERTVEAAGFEIDPAGRRASGNMRRFSARLRT